MLMGDRNIGEMGREARGGVRDTQRETDTDIAGRQIAKSKREKLKVTRPREQQPGGKHFGAALWTGLRERGMGSPPFPRCSPQPCLSFRKMDPPPSLMTMLSAQTLINTLS
jgi:hypothetical protein